MPHQIRKSVFETNSSSSHSLTTADTPLVNQPFSTEVLRAGVVYVGKNEFGWEWHRYYGASEKLSYLLTQVHTDDIPGGESTEVTAQLCENDGRLAMMVQVVKDYTGVDLLFIPGSSGYIDHESVGNGLELFKDEDTFKAFLFNDGYIETGNDNASPPWEISTDRGTELYYAPSIAVPPENAEAVKLSPLGRWHAMNEFATGAGGVFGAESHPELFKAVQEKGVVTYAKWETKRADHFKYEDMKGSTARRLIAEKKDQEGFKLSENFRVEAEYVGGDDYDADLTFVIQVPKEIAEELKKLDPREHLRRRKKEARENYIKARSDLEKDPEHSWCKKRFQEAEKALLKLRLKPPAKRKPRAKKEPAVKP